MRRAAGVTVAVGVVLAMVSACGRGSGDDPASVSTSTSTTSAPAATPRDVVPPATAVTREITSNAGTYAVTCAMPEPVPLIEPFDLEVRVHDARGHAAPVADVELIVDGRMPEHRHGMNVEPLVTRRDDGSFHVEGMVFHMPGDWEIHLDVATPDGVVERAQIEVTLE